MGLAPGPHQSAAAKCAIWSAWAFTKAGRAVARAIMRDRRENSPVHRTDQRGAGRRPSGCRRRRRSRPAIRVRQYRFHVREPMLVRKSSKNFRIGVSSASPENLKKDQGWLAASTDASAANSHSLASLRPRRSAGISLSLSSPRWSRIAPLSKIVRSPSVSHGTWPKGWCAKCSGRRSRKACSRRDRAARPLPAPSARAGRAHSRAACREPSRRW